MNVSRWFLCILVLLVIPFLTSVLLGRADARPEAIPPAKISRVEGYRVIAGKKTPIRINRAMQTELERVLDGVRQMAGVRFDLPERYVLFHLPSPAVLPLTPIGHPVKEVIVTPAPSLWEPPQLLIKNRQNRWVVYKTQRSLHLLVDQVNIPVPQPGKQPTFRTH
ncbi:hypothetical protein C8P63_11711 [Melghirimyces profundicolus]|uniref:Uncharacterized protein n=1 Tax=Melghirimyces profundicolus TaxID=1242148 RepID=A0A2T6BQE2_9BACL|nr:hypothetical protein [Melghirimyces profundicolus]PTX58264.1 hypothetical protein C8P63_11711 [Melghirimyces profundicolus]